MKILVTGFDPFGGEPINPALEAVKALPDTIAGAQIIKLEIPTVFGKAADVVKAAMEDVQPDVVLSIGQAGGRFSVTPERVAINIDDARIPDNEGNQPIDVASASSIELQPLRTSCAWSAHFASMRWVRISTQPLPEGARSTCTRL